MTNPSDLSLVLSHLLAFQRQLLELQNAIAEDNRAQSKALQNVFDRFLQLERRHDFIEELIRSDVIKEYLRLLPAAHTLRWAVDDIQVSELGKLKEYLIDLIEEIDEIFENVTTIKN